MKQQTFKPRKFLGVDFTPRKRYRAEITRLERVNADLQQSLESSEKDRLGALRDCAKQIDMRNAVWAELQKYLRKRGANGKFIKDE